MVGREKPQYGKDALAQIAKAVKPAQPAVSQGAVFGNHRRQRTETGAEPKPELRPARAPTD